MLARKGVSVHVSMLVCGCGTSLSVSYEQRKEKASRMTTGERWPQLKPPTEV